MMIGDEVDLETHIGRVKGRVIEESPETRLVRFGVTGDWLCEQRLVNGEWITEGVHGT